MGSSCPVVIFFTSKLRNCFVNISPLLEREWSNVWKDVNVVKALHLDYGNTDIYTSWSGNLFQSPQHRFAIEISLKFGECLGLKEGEEVLATPLNKVSSCSNVTFIPTSQSDWEISEINSKIIESDLINQLRIIWEGAILPIWIQKNNCFMVTVGEITPKGSAFYQINEFTELKLIPLEKHSSTTNELDSDGETPSVQNPIEASSSSSSSDKSSSNENSSFNKNSKRRSFNLSVGKSLHHAGDKYEQTHTPTFATDIAAIQLYGLRAGVVNLIKGVVFGPNSADVDNGAKSRVYPTAVKAHSREAKIPDTLMARAKKSSLSLFSGIPIESYYRVQDLVVLPNNVTTPQKTFGVAQSLPRKLFEQPSTVFIYCADLTCTVNRLLNDKVTTHGDVSMSKNYVIITASIHKTYSVKERIDMNSSSKRSDMGSNDSTPSDEIRESDPVKLFEQKRYESMNSKMRSVSTGERGSFSSLPTTTVRLVLTNQINFYADQDCRNRALLGEELLPGHIVVNGLLRRQLKLGVKSAVQIKKVLHKPLNLVGIVLNPFGVDTKKAKAFGKNEISAAFTNWIMEITKEYPLILASRMLVSFNITPDVKCEFLLSGIGTGSPNSNTRNMQYYSVSEETLRTASITVGDVIQPSYYLLLSPYPSKNTSLLDEDLPKCSLASLGGFDQLYQTCFDFLLHGLSCQPVSQQLCRYRKPGCNTLLLYGSGSTAGGSGKSSLARALCHQLGRHPILAYISIIDCISLRGKRVETIRKSWRQTFSNSAWHQPAVILFDDLDQLISAPSLLQEHGPEANYTLRLAEVFKGFLRKEVEYSSQIVVLATVTSRDSIHPSLLTSHGNHIFNKTVEIPLPGLDERALMIDCMLRKKEISLSNEDVRVIAVKTEGCSPKDLNTLVARSFQASTMRRNVFKQGLSSMSMQDFTEALKRFKPASLHGIKLHQAADLGWGDVGGLEEIKRILIETLEWPAKYPDLYTNIPMRLPSGILLYGPPGTGKTLLAGVVAKECSLNFISIKGPELLSKYIGASEQAVRDLFNRAQSAKPCILFFDEFDSMAPRRGHDSTGVTDRVVNQLLTQLDGVEGLVGVYILAATSRPDLIDPALLRPGRLDKLLYCGMPEEKDRLEIMKVLSGKLTVHDDVNFEEIARETVNFSGADLKALLCNAQLERIHEIKTTMSGKSDKPLRNSSFLCMPQLQHGPQELPGEENTELQKQIAVLEDNFFKSVCGKADHFPKPILEHSMIIMRNDMMKALSNMGPSVSLEERVKYAAIYHSFMKTKKSGSPQKPMEQRATLA